jgi:antitoxin component HigA of HigAB toxin-antitoxin module
MHAAHTIIVSVDAPEKHGVLDKMEFNVTLKVKRAAQKASYMEDDSPSTGLIRRIDRRLYGLGVEDFTVAFGSKIVNVEDILARRGIHSS